MALIWRVGMRIGVKVRARDKGADGCEGARVLWAFRGR